MLRGAAVTGTALWAAPTVQVLTMTPASAQVASPVGCAQGANTNGAGVAVFDRAAGRSSSGPSVDSSQTGLGTDHGDAGPGPVGTTVATVRTATVVSDSTVSAAAARTLATAVVEDARVDVPGVVVVTATALSSEALVQVTSAGVVTLTPRSTVATVTLTPTGGTPVTVSVTGVENQRFELPLGLAAVTLNAVTRGPGTRTGTLTVVPLLVEVPGAGVVLEFGRSTATATYPVCTP